MTEEQFSDVVFEVARQQGYKIEITPSSLRQIDFGHKKLNEGHIRKLYPNALNADTHLPALIEEVAPGRPCTHRPIREIIEAMTNQQRAIPS